MKRKATAVWLGQAKYGKGTLTTESGALDHKAYSWHSRFEDGEGTNPEELLGAAHAGCFSMKLSSVLENAGFPPERIETTAAIEMQDNVIITSHLTTRVHVARISEEVFQQCAEDARVNCPMSRALNVDVKVNAMIESHVET
jgi:lipoyl-dependent peroxiredoxin